MLDATTTSTKGPDMLEGKRILVAEDDKDVLEMYQDFFSLHKNTRNSVFSYTHNVKTTTEALENNEYDLVLLDLGLEDFIPPPGLAILKEYAKRIKAKIVVISAYGEFKDECLSYGAAQFLPKPIELSSIIEAFQKTG